jgi:hypothetical protein
MKQKPLIAVAYLVSAMVLSLFLSTTAVYAKQHSKKANAKSNAKTYLLRQSTQWAADIRVVISPLLMQLDADHVGYSIQYSKEHQSICAWRKDTKQYVLKSMDDWLRRYRNVAMSVTWTADLKQPTTVTSARQNNFKVNHYVYENIQIARAFFSSEIGFEKEKPRGTGYIETVELGVDPNVEEILSRLSALPKLSGVPFAVYVRSPQGQPYNNTLSTSEFVSNPSIRPLKLFVPTGYTRIQSFGEILVPKSSIQELL